MDASNTDSSTCRTILPALESPLLPLQQNGDVTAGDGCYRTLEEVTEDKPDDEAKMPIAVEL